MASAYIDLILPAFDSLAADDEETVIAGGDLILDAIDGKLPRRCMTQALRHEEMQQAISNCRRFVSVPGIGSIYEGASARTPTFFLPPTNLTQLLQSRCLAEYLDYPHQFLPFSGFSDPWSFPEPSDEEGFIVSLFDHYRTQCTQLGRDLKEKIERFKSEVRASKPFPDHFAKLLGDHLSVERGSDPVKAAVAHLYGNVELE